MKKIYRVVGNDSLMTTRDGRFFKILENNIVEEISIPKSMCSIFAKYMLDTFIGPFNGHILYKDSDESNIRLDNLNYELFIIHKSEDILCINGEDFKRIPGFSRYFISQNGVVYGTFYQSLLRIKINKFQYYTIGISNDKGIRKFMMIHRLVYITWVGPIPDEMEINHKNSKQWINSLYNLEIATSLENVRYGIHYNNRYSKWNANQIHSICELIQEGYYPTDIYKILNFKDFIDFPSFTSMCNYLRNKRKFWKDITSQYDFSKAYIGHPRKYSDELIYNVRNMLRDGILQNDIAKSLNIDFRVVSDIKRQIKKPIYDNEMCSETVES